MEREIDVPDLSLTDIRKAREIEEARFEKKEKERKIRIAKKNTKLKRIAATSILIAGVGLSVVAKGSWQRGQGESYICDKYSISEIMSNLNVSFRDSTVSGLVITMNGKQVSLDYFLASIKDGLRSYYPGITDVEMKIVLDNAVPTSLDSYFKDVSDEDVSKTKESAYHEMKAEELSKGVNK